MVYQPAVGLQSEIHATSSCYNLLNAVSQLDEARFLSRTIVKCRRESLKQQFILSINKENAACGERHHIWLGHFEIGVHSRRSRYYRSCTQRKA
jgi:hypothetical protein